MAIPWPSHEKIRTLFFVDTLTPGELECLGLVDKVSVHWLDFPGHVVPEARESFKPGYYEGVNPTTPYEKRRLINLEEAYPPCLIVRKGNNTRSSLIIEGLPNGGIKEIDFTHYSLGPTFSSYMQERDELSWMMSAGVISFHKEAGSD